MNRVGEGKEVANSNAKLLHIAYYCVVHIFILGRKLFLNTNFSIFFSLWNMNCNAKIEITQELPKGLFLLICTWSAPSVLPLAYGGEGK